MMINVLVVSDNLPLTVFFQGLAQEKLLNIAKIDYCYSEVNKSPAELIAIGAQPLNLKSSEIICALSSKYDFVFSLHCKQIFPRGLVNAVKCINLHPGLNPHNRGWYPQVFSIINKKPAGATLHYMDEQVDHGAIIAQQEVIVSSWDTSFDVYNRIFHAEKKLLEENLEAVLSGDVQGVMATSEGNYNSISDFNSICELDLSNVGTFMEHIDILRALTHSNFNNAYYIDADGRKIFIKIKFFPDF